MVVTTVTDMQSDKQETTATHAREGVSVGVVLCDAAGHALHVDDAAAALIGLDPERRRHRAPARLAAFRTAAPRRPAARRSAPSVSRRASWRRAASPVHDVIVVLPAVADCPARRLQITAEPLRTPGNGGPSGIVVVLVDVTVDVELGAAGGGAGRRPRRPRRARVPSGAPARRLTARAARLCHARAGHRPLQERPRLARPRSHRAARWQVAGRLQRDLRDDDFVARTGEGDFLLLLAGTSTSTDVARAVERIKAAFDRRWETGGREVFLTPSIGIAIFPSDGADGDELLRNADMAMCRAKAAGGNTWQFFHDGIDPAGERASGPRERAAQGARAATNFCCTTSPRSTLQRRRGRRRGADALEAPRARHRPAGRLHPAGRGDRPDRADRRLGARRGLPRRRSSGPGAADPDRGVRMAVNLSPRQFEQHDLVGTSRTTLERDRPRAAPARDRDHRERG